MKMNINLIFLAASVIILGAPSFAAVNANKYGFNDGNGTSSPPNTKQQTDRQKTNTADIEITRRIRQDLLNQKNISADARNVQITTLNGKVTLRGQVHSMTEHDNVLQYANTAAGYSNVVNEMEVLPQETTN